jgi:hypothetical protein
MARLQNIAARGVYHLPWHGRNGEIFLAAVDRFGRRILDAVVYPDQDVQAAERAMRELLDREDPTPAIRLVS